jgi:hypothetical protein
MTEQGPGGNPGEQVGLNPQPLPPRWLAWLPAPILRLFGYARR